MFVQDIIKLSAAVDESIIQFSHYGYLRLFRRYSRLNLKLSEITPNFARFWLPVFLTEGIPNFWT